VLKSFTLHVSFFFAHILFFSNLCFAEEFSLDAVKIFGKQDEAYLEPGSVYLIDNKELELKQSLNPHEVLKEVPGVIIQEEDGLGLRPNIGLRGAHPHRSRKVTLMEDGVLIAPAPYSAPAAYYFPLFSKITGVEVYKGPSSIKYGPNSVGGAINFLTRDYFQSEGGKNQSATLNVSYGSFNTLKLQSYASGRLGKLDWLIEANR
jgi:Fe(3+) dicitrate transport protein